MTEERARPVSPASLRSRKERGERIVMLTAYDCPSARILDEAGVDVILVGDSLSMVVLGNETTLPVTLDEMLHHTRAVARGAAHALVVGDMPYGSYHLSPRQALESALRFVKEAGAGAVKLEGGRRRAETVRALVQAEIPVMGHVGLTPQSIRRFGGYKVQGRGEEGAREVLDGALALEEAGCFAVVLEGVPAPLARVVTRHLSVPTIGIGAGSGCDGQVLVFHDMLGMSDLRPKFVRVYAEIGQAIGEAVGRFCRDVREGGFPDDESEAYQLDPEAAAALEEELRRGDDDDEIPPSSWAAGS